MPGEIGLEWPIGGWRRLGRAGFTHRPRLREEVNRAIGSPWHGKQGEIRASLTGRLSYNELKAKFVMLISCVCGARPNFMKMAPLTEAFAGRSGLRTLLVHTGQHYDEQMSRLFFEQLGMPRPDINLEAGSGSHAQQTALIMQRFEPVCLEHRPDWLVVVGDVNSTIACALVAAKLGIRIAHVEAGLRSFDRSMPEEINRVLTDAISDLLFVTEASAVENLRREGAAPEKIHFVGNVMIDTLLRHKARAEALPILDEMGLSPRRFVLVTLHRPGNVDDPLTLRSILSALNAIAKERDVVFPVHPRTAARLKEMSSSLDGAESGRGGHSLHPRLHLAPPLGYLEFLKLMSAAEVVITDSGGVQEETTILRTPCLTVRPNTERPVTLEQGTNRLVPPTREAILNAVAEMRRHPPNPSTPPPLWDGRAAQRIAAVFESLI